MSLITTVKKLSNISARAHGAPVDGIDWPESLLPESAWFSSPELMALSGSESFAAMDEAMRRRLSFFEAVNFYSLNINGEKPLVEGLSRRLYATGFQHVLPYLHHFLDEENKHMQYFGRFCLSYAGKTYPDRKVVFPRSFAEGEEDFLFFVKIVIFEEIADHHNVLQAADERLHPLARKINLLHHQDEARHLIFGRELVAELFSSYRAKWSEATLAGLRAYIPQYIVATWKEYYNPDPLRDAGLANAYELMEEAWDHPLQRQRRVQVSAKCISFLTEQGILTEEVPL